MASPIFEGRKPTKEMIFGWCKTGAHDKCRVRYGNNRIVCICDCEDHGVNYVQLNKQMSEAEIKEQIAIIDRELAAKEAASRAENRAIQPTSSIWGEQVSRLMEFDEDGTDEHEEYKKTYEYRNNRYELASGFGSSKYEFKEVQDASTIEELESRRLATSY